MPDQQLGCLSMAEINRNCVRTIVYGLQRQYIPYHRYVLKTRYPTGSIRWPNVYTGMCANDRSILKNCLIWPTPNMTTHWIQRQKTLCISYGLAGYILMKSEQHPTDALRQETSVLPLVLTNGFQNRAKYKILLFYFYHIVLYITVSGIKFRVAAA